MAKLDDAYDPLTPVPAERRVFGTRDAFSLWFSLGIGLLVLQAGAFLVPGLSLPMALAAIVVGSVLGALLLAAAGVVGADTGLSSMGALRLTLGKRGAAVPAVLNAVQLAGWGAFEIIAMRDAADALAKQNFGVSSPLAWTLLFGGLATALAVLGPVSFVRRFLRAWGLWLLLGGAGWLTWRLLAQHDLAALMARAGTGETSFGAGVDLVAAMPLSWLPLIADYTRFGRTPGGMFRGSVAGYVLANIWFMGLGAAYALAAGGEGLLLSALAAAGGGIALLLIIIDETDNAFADLHSAAVSTATLVPVRPARLALAFGTVCTLAALLAPMGRYEGFLLLIGSVFAPLFGVLLADHFIVRRRKAPTGAEGAASVSGLAAWAIGIAAYQAVSRLAPEVGATLPAVVVAGAAYVGLRRVVKR
ncbi:putative hydroxymethylpyrimidine transporter CytX [Caulobacter sp. D4A]|uniref:putative hydroxymethylpyrimidine transporter CytX n=1 Tax=unclassified Caulobacter TaxID=2648921 RepID=UPI000D73942B|nr:MULTISPECIES: putative hydroxymethylpyrimidine transporter CytX [unclassified Caulobacter]PXA77597.1 putative hydroxymethylpyrimidine transporter CytX [Caulobacter sp. D4A]PXA96136.1 putative hydroxymethylpyrimidine transporter CytX [Caulobacter sp. D5]